MLNLTFLALLLFISFVTYKITKNKQIHETKMGKKTLNAPIYSGLYTAFYIFTPAFFLFLLLQVLQHYYLPYLLLKAAPANILSIYGAYPEFTLQKIKALANGDLLAAEENYSFMASHYLQIMEWLNWGLWFILTISILSIFWIIKAKTNPLINARHQIEKLTSYFLFSASLIAILTTLGVVLSLLFEAFKFFQQIPLLNFLFGTHWTPQNSIDNQGQIIETAFGAFPIFTGTFMVASIALLIAAPIGLFTAIYLSEYAPQKIRNWTKPLLEILAGIPTVVYGFFAAITLAPFMKKMGLFLGLNISLESALTAGIVMGIMIIPFISSIATDVISAVPQRLRDGSLGLGATHSETIYSVVIPAALPGILSGILLAFSRAVGETMIVVMAAGMIPNLTANPFESVTTVTVQITALMTGEQAFDSLQTLSAYALALTLFVLTLMLNILSLFIIKKYQEKYE